MVSSVPDSPPREPSPDDVFRRRREELRPPLVLRAQLHYGPPLFGYVLSFALVLITGVLRLSLFEYGNFFYPLIFFQPAIALASFLGGAGPGLAGIVLGALFGLLFFPEHPSPTNWIGFAVIGPLLVTGCAHLRFLRDRSRAIAHELVNFKLIGDQASDWILLIGQSGHIRYVNLKAATDLGWTDLELTGRHIETIVPETERPILNATLDRASARIGKPVEIAFERRDKSLALMELGCTAVWIEEEHVVHAAARDIGERKRIEKQLQEIRHWESLGVLAGGLSHDFNNLLTSILGNASLAKEMIPRDDETAPLLDAIMQAAERSSELVRMLLASSGYRSHFREPLLLDQILEGTLRTRPLPATVRIVRQTDSARYMGDRSSFETLLWSLISNAADAYGESQGDVKVTIRSGPAPVRSGSSFEEGDPGRGECLGIIVEDSGSGMLPEVLKRAFDPFFTTRFTGRGLGLPAVRGIVRAYSGKLSIETAPGRGTRVEVWLPQPSHEKSSSAAWDTLG